MAEHRHCSSRAASEGAATAGRGRRRVGKAWVAPVRRGRICFIMCCLAGAGVGADGEGCGDDARATPAGSLDGAHRADADDAVASKGVLMRDALCDASKGGGGGGGVGCGGTAVGREVVVKAHLFVYFFYILVFLCSIGFWV